MKPDYTLERDGVPLSDWLWRLVAEDRPTRERAGKALESIREGLPKFDMSDETLEEEPEFDAQHARFDGAVIAVLQEPAFDTKGFLNWLSALLVALHTDHLRRVDVHMSRLGNRTVAKERGSEMERAIARAGDSEGSDARQDHPATYYAAYLREKQTGSRAIAEGEGMGPSGWAATTIARRIGSTWLDAPDALHFMLDVECERYKALEILAEIGTPAVSFATRLLQEIDAYSGSRTWNLDGEGRTLGRIGAGSPKVVEEVLSRVNHPTPPVRRAAALALESMDGNLCGRHRKAVETLFASARQWGEQCHLTAIASAGRHLPAVRAFLVEIVLGNPAKWTSGSAVARCVVEPSMGDCGWAIDALRYLTDYPDECIPVLIVALDTFEEFDPDECCDGPHNRIISVLESFGAKSADAVVPVARELKKVKEDDGYPRTIIDYLGSLGPLAGAALPYLEAYRERTWYPEEPLPDLAAGPADEFEDPVGWVIQRIWGTQA